MEPLRLLAASRRLSRADRGDGRALIAYPGFGANDSSSAPLRAFLRSKGHDANGWGLGVNRGDPADVLSRCLPLLEQLAADSGRAVNLVGWSLGGVFARELARDHPDLVHRVATFGTPIYGPRYSVAARAYSEAQLAAIDNEIDERYQRPLTTPLLAIRSPNDGVVDHRSCFEDRTPGAVNVEVGSAHLTMGLDPDVWVTLARWFSPDQAV